MTEIATWAELGYRPFQDIGGLTKVPPGHTVHHKRTGRSGDVIGVYDKGLVVSWHDKPYKGPLHYGLMKGENNLAAGDDIAWGEYELRYKGQPVQFGQR